MRKGGERESAVSVFARRAGLATAEVTRAAGPGRTRRRWRGRGASAIGLPPMRIVDAVAETALGFYTQIAFASPPPGRKDLDSALLSHGLFLSAMSIWTFQGDGAS